MFGEIVHVVIHPVETLVGNSHGCSRGIDDFPFKHVIDSSILYDLAIYIEARYERTRSESLQHGIARGSHSTLYRQEGLWYPALFHVFGKKVCHVESYLHRVLVRLLESPRLLWNVALNDTYNLAGVYCYVVVAETVVGRMNVHHLPAFPALMRLPCVVEETRVGVVELIVFQYDLLGKTHHCGDDASC